MPQVTTTDPKGDTRVAGVVLHPVPSTLNEQHTEAEHVVAAALTGSVPPKYLVEYGKVIY